jgi:hypothetical protein
MKKNTFRGILLAGVIFTTAGMYAQSSKYRGQIAKYNDTERLKQLTTEFTDKFKRSHAEALRLAKLNNWPVEIQKEDGGLISLIKMAPEGFPIYYETSNLGSAITSRANLLQPGGSSGLNLTGGDLFVGVWDGGIPRISHRDINGRAVVNDGANSVALHPTHVLGTILGSGATDPAAKGIATETLATVNDWTNDLAEMASQISFDLLVSNHSYGYRATSIPASYLGAYVEDSRDLDALTFTSPYYLPVCAAGNDNNGATYKLLTGYGTSKNSLVVAAVHQVDDYTGPQDVNIASFSNWGPTNDNRIKPDISSKGVSVYSTSNASDTAHAYLDGTSMASPGIVGVIALLQQHFLNLHLNDPGRQVYFMKSATTKALLAHTADEAGSNDGPDARFGWGLANAYKSAQTLTAAKTGTTAVVDERVLLAQQTYSINVHATGNEPLVATIAWTDPEGTISTGTTTQLVNDLDIRITQGTQTVLPWRLGSSFSAAAQRGDNTKDNIEKAELANPSGNYTITVSHKGNTLRNTTTGAVPSQEYSLIVTGIDLTMAALDPSKEQMFTVYPNPASDKLTISLNDGLENASVSFTDVQGRNVFNTKITSASSILDINHLTAGVYFVKIASGSRTEVKKIIVN